MNGSCRDPAETAGPGIFMEALLWQPAVRVEMVGWKHSHCGWESDIPLNPVE